MLDPQNFSVYAGNYTEITVDIDPDDELELVGATIVFRVYPQSMGLPVAGEDPVIEKDNGDGGTITVTDPETQTLMIPFEEEDTVDLLRTYYHETTVIEEGRPTTIAIGLITVLGTENRD